MEQVQIELLIEAGSAPKTLGEVKQSIKDINKAIADVPFGSENFRRLDAVLKENRETVRNLKKEFDTMQNVSIFAKNLSGAFGLATSAVALFGSENKKLNETLQKVTGALALVQSVQQFTEGLKLAESANKALNASLLTNPYVLIASAIAAAALALYAFGQEEEATTEKTIELNKANLEHKQRLEEIAIQYGLVTGKLSKYSAEVQKINLDRAKQIADVAQQEQAALNKEKENQESWKMTVINWFVDEEREQKRNADRKAAIIEEFNKKRQQINEEADAKVLVAQAENENEQNNQLKDKLKERLEEYKRYLNDLASENARLERVFIQETKDGLDERLTLYDLDAEKRREDLWSSGLSELQIEKIIADGRQQIIDEDIAKRQKAIDDANQKRVQANLKSLELDVTALKQAGKASLEAEIKLEIERRNALLANINLTEKEKENIIRESNLTIERLKKESADKQFKTEQDKFKSELAEVQLYIQAIGNVLSQVGNLITQGVQQQVDDRISEYQREKDAAVSLFDERLKQNLISQNEYDALVAAQEREFKKKKNKELRKQFIAQKTVSIIQATINTAASVVQALATMPPPASYVFAALNGALGAAQIGLIAAQKPPQEFAKGGVFHAATGGMVTGAGSGTSDSINARLSNGESIINARSTSAFAPVLSAINELGGGIAFTGQPSVISNPSGVQPNKTEESPVPNYISVSISEAEISKVQNRVQRVNVRSTF